MLTFSSIRSCRVTKRKAKDDSGFGLGELSLRTRVWSNLAPIDEAHRLENEINKCHTWPFIDLNISSIFLLIYFLIYLFFLELSSLHVK